MINEGCDFTIHEMVYTETVISIMSIRGQWRLPQTEDKNEFIWILQPELRIDICIIITVPATGRSFKSSSSNASQTRPQNMHLLMIAPSNLLRIISVSLRAHCKNQFAIVAICWWARWMIVYYGNIISNSTLASLAADFSQV